jgi:prepilin-type N-terminal cleavage/methylation domain-containing protein
LKINARSQPFSTRHRAFSIVEVLVVVAILGVFSATVIAFFGGYHRDVVLKVRDRRNAQEISALVMGATASGAQVIQAGNMEATIQNLIEGRVGTIGSFKGRTFRISEMTEDEIAGAIKYLEWREGLPLYLHGDD